MQPEGFAAPSLPFDADAPAFAPPVCDAARFDWLRLSRSSGVGPLSFRRLAARFATPADALEALPDLRGLSPADAVAVEREIAAAARIGARLLCFGAPDYPPLLAQIPDAPPALWALGDPSMALNPCVAIVGARNASAVGRRMAALLAEGLGAAGWVVVSGLARGIDAAAHEAALPTGTVAVHAGGADVVYPPENAALADRIAAEGLRLSEAPMGEQPVARSFPRRNRIVSGLSSGVLLVEAADRSGSLITARMAAEQGREVMAVPGSPLDPRASGCNALIREGAALIRDAHDALEAMAAPHIPRRAPPPAPRPPGDGLADRVAALLGPAPVGFDALAQAAGVDTATLAGVLTELELAGRIDRRPGDLIALA